MSRIEEIFQQLDEREFSKYLLTADLNDKEIDYLIDQSADYYFGDLLDNPTMRDKLIVHILNKEDYSLIYELFLCMYGEYTIPAQYLEKLFVDENRYELQAYIGGSFRLEYKYVIQLLHTINSFVDLGDFLRTQKLEKNDIEFILSEVFCGQFVDNDDNTQETIFDILIRFHQIPEPLLTTWITMKHEKLREIIEKQTLTPELQEMILFDETLKSNHILVFAEQTFSAELIDRIIASNNTWNIQLLAAMQRLSPQQIEKIFDFENAAFTEQLLLNQQFSDKERAKLSLRFPEFRTVIINNRESRKMLDNRTERRRRRDYELKK